MMLPWFRWLVLAALLGGLEGCGEAGEQAGPGAGAGGATAGSSGSGGQGAGGSGAGGGSAAGGAGATAQAGLGSIDCSGTFGTPVPILDEASDVLLSSPTLSPDALELIYVRGRGTQIEFHRSTRDSLVAPFPVGAPLPDLDAACQPGDARSADLSYDGLRAYVVCYSATAEPTGPGMLHVADRAGLAASFVFRSDSLRVGPSAAISRDELTLFSASDIDVGSAPPLQFTRSSLSATFGAGETISGLEGVFLSSPDPSPDGLSLYGGLLGDVVEARRSTASAAFGAPIVLYSRPSTNEQLGAPELSQDCRSLFYLHQTYEGGLLRSQLLMARR